MDFIAFDVSDMDAWIDVGRVAAILFAAYVAILWIAIVVWTFRDIEARTADTMTQAVATGLVGIFFLPGLLLYLALRPSETVEQRAERMIEAEAFAREISADPRCTRCARRVQADYLVCPHCAATLRSPCTGCARPVESTWSACPYCATPIPTVPRAAASAPRPVRRDGPGQRIGIRDGQFATGQTRT